MAPRPPSSSRRRYAEYLKARREYLKKPVAERGGDEEDAKKKRRLRNFRELFREFWALLGGHRLAVYGALATQASQALLLLLMPVCTKFAIDYAILPNPGPAGIPK